MSELRFLADESCDFAVVRSLRSNGYDILAVSEYMKRSVDRDLIEQAHRELVQKHKNDLKGAFVVVQPGQVRFSRKDIGNRSFRTSSIKMKRSNHDYQHS
jgi:ribonuclease P protein component